MARLRSLILYRLGICVDTDNPMLQVGDFNLSRAMKTDTVEPSATMNSPAWSAPERLQGLRYGKSADVFSFGVILWELITLGE